MHSRTAIKSPVGDVELTVDASGNWIVRTMHNDASAWSAIASGSIAEESAQLTNGIANDEPILVGALLVDPMQRAVTVNGADLELPPKQYELAWALAQDPTRVFTKEELMRTVWRADLRALKTRTLDSTASRLRCSISKALDREVHSYVENCWGVGYRLYRS